MVEAYVLIQTEVGKAGISPGETVAVDPPGWARSGALDCASDAERLSGSASGAGAAGGTTPALGAATFACGLPAAAGMVKRTWHSGQIPRLPANSAFTCKG